jgi:hypothetical protein
MAIFFVSFPDSEVTYNSDEVGAGVSLWLANRLARPRRCVGLDPARDTFVRCGEVQCCAVGLGLPFVVLVLVNKGANRAVFILPARRIIVHEREGILVVGSCNQY